MSQSPSHERILANPVVDWFLRFCAYLFGGTLIAFVFFIAFLLIRVYYGFAPLPEDWLTLVIASIAAGIMAAALAYFLHRLARRR